MRDLKGKRAWMQLLPWCSSSQWLWLKMTDIKSNTLVYFLVMSLEKIDSGLLNHKILSEKQENMKFLSLNVN